MRQITYGLESILKDKKRIPDYKLFAYNPTVDKYSKIITANSTCSPLDITDHCSEISWSPSELTFTLKDVTGNFNPDSGIYGDYLGDGCIIRLKEGDARIAEAEWVWTFTGAIKGQLGWVKNRKSKTLEAKVTVYSRENTLAFKRRKITTKEYTVGADLGVMFADIGDKMGLTTGEMRVPSVFGTYFTHKTNQVSQEAPWEAMKAILEVIMEVPIFDGEGRLSSYKKDLNRNPDIIFTDESYVHSYEVVSRTDDAYNKVIVKFLDCNLSRVENDEQSLGSAEVTTGFFTLKEELKCWWSDDRKQRAENTYLKVLKGVNDNLLPIGTESYEEIDEYHGMITVEISIFVPILATTMLVAYVAASWIPDGVVTGGVIFEAGETIPYGRYLQAVLLVGILAIMMSIGSAQYEIWGTPYDLAYQEKRTIAIISGTAYYEENEVTIENDFIGTHDRCDTIAACELTYQVSKAFPRKLVIDDYLGLEIGDIIQIYDGRKVFIQDMKKSIKRGTAPTLEITGFKVRAH